jgi:anti-anti-sigma factor
VLFDVQVLERSGWSVVAVVGDVDLATLPTLRQDVELVDGARVALDLSSVDHFDPLAFGVVVWTRMRVQRRGGRFAVVCPPGRPRELFEESGVDRIVDVVDSFEQLQDS